MPKLRRFSARQLITLLEAHDFAIVRQRGSHVVLQQMVGDNTVTVIVPNHSEIREGTLRSIIRQSRLPRALFEAGA